MKKQQYRFKLIAILLAGLLLAIGIYGAQRIPLTGSGPSLREAIFRLTGRQSPSPPPEASAASASWTPSSTDAATPEASRTPMPSGDAATVTPDNSLGQILFPDTYGETATVTSDSSLGQMLFPEASETASPAPSSVQPLSEALSDYFSTNAPTTQKGPDTP